MYKKISQALINIPETILIGICAGFISGLLGLGGGIILVPALVFILKINQRIAQGTTLLVIIPTALIGSIRYFFAGHLSLPYTIWVAAGSMLGVLFGSFIAHNLHPNILRKAFGIFMIIVAMKMYWG
ncbi:MAG: sulfite exporter TauE/SafE family protein [Candidatus Margulisbacteria bacterium]|nr:sulfite exporter TauE/SafE family protein [Candidatus Margulisiibacteriota bacterium]